MKKIINRKTGNSLTIEEAIQLCKLLKYHYQEITIIDHTSVHGYPTPELAEKANLRAICEAYEGYTFAYIGPERKMFEGYKVRAIGIQKMPSHFEELNPNFVVIG